MGEESYNSKKVYKATAPTDAEIAAANEANYNQGSVAQQRNSSNTYGYVATGNSFGSPRTEFGIGGAPAEGDERGKGFGRAVGTGLGKVLGVVTAPIAFVGNAGVNTLRGINETSGVHIDGVGYRQNPGYSYGQQNSHFFGGASYNSGSVAGRNYSNRSSGLLNDPNLERSQGSSRGAQQQNSQFFFADETGRYALFGEKAQNIAGQGGIYTKDAAGKAFVEGYNTTLREANRHRDSIETLEKEGGKASDFHYPEHAILRQDLGSAIFLASMRRAADPANAEDYENNPNTVTAAQKFFRDGLDHRMFGIQQGAELANLNVKSKATIDKLMLAYGSIGMDNDRAEELAKIMKTSKSEAALVDSIDNFLSPARSQTVKALDSDQKIAYQELSHMKFTDPLAQKVQTALLTSPTVWKGNQGIATDIDAQRFVIYPIGRDFALRMVNETVVDGVKKSETVDVIIPSDKLEATFALVAKQSIADKKKDIKFKDSAEEITALVKTYGTDTAANFNGKVGETLDLLEAAAKAKQTAIDQGAAAEQKAKDIAKATEGAKKELPDVEQRIVSLTTERNAAATEKTTAQAAVDAAKTQLETSEKTAQAAKAASENSSFWQRYTLVAMWPFGNPTFINKPELELAAAEKGLAAKKAELASAETAFKTAESKYSVADASLTELVAKKTQITAQISGSEEAIAQANKAAQEAAKLLAETNKAAEANKAETANAGPEAFANKVVAQLQSIGLKDDPNTTGVNELAQARTTALEAAKKIIATEDPAVKEQIIKGLVAELRSKAQDAGRNTEVLGVKMGDSGAQIANTKVSGILPALRQIAIQDLNLAPEEAAFIASNSVVQPIHPSNQLPSVNNGPAMNA